MNIARALSTETTISRNSAPIIAGALQAAGYGITSTDLMANVATFARWDSYRGLWVIRNRVDLRWSFADLQDTLSAAGYRGSDLYHAWSIVRGNLYARFSRGNYTQPRPSTVLRWAAAEHRAAA